MGCHVWFYRPIKDEEFELMKEYCIKDAEDFWGDTEKNREFNCVDLSQRDLIVKSFRENIPCIDGFYWYQLNYGCHNPKLGEGFYTYFVEGKLFVECMEFWDLGRCEFGIKTYPKKVIHNKRELRKYVGKKYFNLTNEQNKKLSEFWSKYPGGIMCWG